MNYQINSDKILFTQLGDEGVLYDTESNEYLTINETFFYILKSIDQNLSVDEIVSKLCSVYVISEIDCRSEVEKVIADLLHKNYIVS